MDNRYRPRQTFPATLPPALGPIHEAVPALVFGGSSDHSQSTACLGRSPPRSRPAALKQQGINDNLTSLSRRACEVVNYLISQDMNPNSGITSLTFRRLRVRYLTTYLTQPHRLSQVRTDIRCMALHAAQQVAAARWAGLLVPISY